MRRLSKLVKCNALDILPEWKQQITAGWPTLLVVGRGLQFGNVNARHEAAELKLRKRAVCKREHVFLARID